VTDIVEKEMYTFDDRNGESLTLRPEGTAGCLRACLEQGLLHNQIQRLWYYGPRFRHERPQKGRYRQFYQLGIETYGMAGPDIDTEILLLTDRLWRQLGIRDKLELQLNSLGSIEERLVYREQLVAYFSQYPELLDEDSQRRLLTNPLRILDTKNPDMQALVAGAPELMDCLGTESLEHFQTITARLDKLGVAYRINTRLVRGLDYYSKTVFEWVTTELGAQGTVCAGGRYDGLVAQLGGKPNYAIGFAMGMERLLSLMEMLPDLSIESTVDVYMILVGEQAEEEGLLFSEAVRTALPGLKLLVNCGGGSIKSQFKKADKSAAHYALIIGEDEALNAQVSLKSLRTDMSQQTLSQAEIVEYLREQFKQH
ncbi:MAG: histidine--tRNA ligase, partial [Methylococcales bacterium]|nr:histidine--tRNA ligase [Methylococcales bacterium]